MSAGELRERVTFSKRVLVSDGAGNERGDFQDQFTVHARITPLRGGEAVISARLAGRQPVAIKVRQNSQTLLIEADWRAMNVRTGEVYALTSPPADQEERRKYLVLTGVIGEAA